MTISLRSTSTITPATRTNTVVTPPAGATTGDVIVVCLSCGGSSLVTPAQPGGWTAGGAVSYGDPGDPWYVQIQVWVKAYAGESSWTFTHASHNTEGVVQAWTGGNTASPLDVAASTAFQNRLTQTGTTTATAPSITIVHDAAMLLAFRGSWNGDPITPPSGWTERLDASVSWVGTKEQATAGPTGAVGVPAGQSDDRLPWGIILTALAPADDIPPAYGPTPIKRWDGGKYVDMEARIWGGTGYVPVVTAPLA